MIREGEPPDPKMTVVLEPVSPSRYSVWIMRVLFPTHSTAPASGWRRIARHAKKW
jgi:hypothetical protein